MSTWKLVAGALVASLAIAVQAQEPPKPWPQSQPPAEPQPGQPQPQAAPAPAPAPAPQAQPQTGQAAQLTAEQKTAIGEVQAQNQLAIKAADMAASRGASDEVKNIGRWLGNDHRRVQGELAKMLQPRGAQGALPAPASPQRQKIEQELAQLESRSGEQFDREFMTFLTHAQPAYVDALKRARDVTAGKDPVFKKFLDDVENLEEGHLTGIRQAKAQRQARTPPAR